MLEEEKGNKLAGAILFVLCLVFLGCFLSIAYFSTVSCAAIAGLFVSWSFFVATLKCLVLMTKVKVEVVAEVNKEEKVEAQPEEKVEEVVTLDTPVVVEESAPVVEVKEEKAKSKSKKAKAKTESVE